MQNHALHSVPLAAVQSMDSNILCKAWGPSATLSCSCRGRVGDPNKIQKNATDQLFQLFQGLNTNQRHQSNFVPAIVSTPGKMYRCSVLSPIYGNNLAPSVMERMELSSSTISIFDVQGEH